MFHRRGANNKINYLHERSLQLVYKDNFSSLTDFASNCVNTNKFGLNLLKHPSTVWNMVPLKIKNYGSVKKFKTKIRN